MRKLNNFNIAGVLFIGIFLFLHLNGSLPDFFEGLCAGAGIVLSLLGFHAQNHDISKIRNYKRNFLKTVLGNK